MKSIFNKLQTLRIRKHETGYRCLLCAVFINGFCSSQPCLISCPMLPTHFSHHYRHCFPTLRNWDNFFELYIFRVFSSSISKHFRESCVDTPIHKLVTIQIIFENKISNYWCRLSFPPLTYHVTCVQSPPLAKS